MSIRFTTDHVAVHERLDYWREAICDVFVQLDCRSARRRGFYGHVTSEALERLKLSEVDAESQHVSRGRRQLAKAKEDDFLLSLQLTGAGLVRQDDRDAVLAPGSMALYASTRPYELIFAQSFRQLVVQLPRELLSTAIANPDDLTARTLTPAVPETRLLGAALGGLYADAAAFAPAARSHVVTSVVEALAAALATLPGATTGKAFEPRVAARARIRAFVSAHLDDPNLSPSMIARAMGFSRQHLYRLYAGSDESLERYMWSLRLERVRADLENAALGMVPIAELAARHGFVSPEHFSRSFRRRYGATALQIRRARKR